MTDCSYCGAPLVGAKRFCVKCGREQKDYARPEPPSREDKRSKPSRPEGGECHKCGEPTERKCYFCEKPICNVHSTKMQANVLPAVEFRSAISLGDRKRVNQGWRGFIIDTCSRCSSINDGKILTEDEKIEIRTVDNCSWFQLKPKEHKFDVGHYWQDEHW